MKQNKNIGQDNGLFLYTGFRSKKFDESRFLIFVVDSGSGKSYTLFIWQPDMREREAIWNHKYLNIIATIKDILQYLAAHCLYCIHQKFLIKVDVHRMRLLV